MNYLEQSGEATSWRRAHEVSISNPYGGVPSVMFHEQDITQVGGRVYVQNLMPLGAKFNQAGRIELVNPETGEPLGSSVSQLDLYVILHSLYMSLAKVRDAAIPAPAP